MFSLETLQLLARQDYLLASLNITCSILLWLVAVWIRNRIATRASRRRGA